LAKTGPFDRNAVEYDRWYEEHRSAYAAELAAVRSILPTYSRPLEIGVGTGRFAGPLGVHFGVEPSATMRAIAESRGIEVVEAVAENLPFGDGEFDLVLMVTTVCFLDDLKEAFRESRRVLVDGGWIIVGFLDRETALGREYEAHRSGSRFYSVARFRSSAEILGALESAGFGDIAAVQTIFPGDTGDDEIAPLIREGLGEGLFAAVRGQKQEMSWPTGRR